MPPAAPSPAPPVAPPAERPLAGIGMRLFAAGCMQAMFALVKLCERHGVGVIEQTFYRQLFSLPLVVAWVLLSGAGPRSLRTNRPGAHFWRMAVGLTGMIFNFWGVTLLPLAEATTFGFTVPIFATILSAVVLREPTGRHRWGAVVAGFAGVLVILQPGGHAIPWFGAGVAMTGAFATASVSILIRQLGATERAATTVFWFALSSLLPLGAAMLFVAQAHDATTWALIAGMGVMGGCTQIGLTTALRFAPVAVVLPMDYTGLLWATLYGWLLFATLPAAATLVGAPIIVASGLYIVWREQVRRRPIPPRATSQA